MSFYYLSEEMGLVLNDILGQCFSNQKEYLMKDISITWINYQNKNNKLGKGYGYGINNTKPIYPASIVKLVYGLATYYWIDKGRILLTKELSDAVYNMLYYSSNDATSFVVDIITGTTSGPCIQGECWEKWKYQRSIINDWLKTLGWSELYGINCCQKTWDDNPYGREKEFYGIHGKNKNLMTTDSTARIMEQIMVNIDYQKDNLNLKNCLKRTLNKRLLKEDPLNQIEGFLGEGLPENINFWSKAGLMSQVRHDSAWWLSNQSVHTLLVVFCNGKHFFQDKSLFPEIAKAVHKYNNDHFI